MYNFEEGKNELQQNRVIRTRCEKTRAFFVVAVVENRQDD